MTQIIGFAGKKQSGKNTCCNFIVMLKLIENGVCRKAKLSDDGLIYVSDVFGESSTDEEYMPFKDPHVHVGALLKDMGEVKIYAMADGLKEMAMGYFGLSYESVYGTDEQKNQVQEHLLWENMPGIITPNQLAEIGLAYRSVRMLPKEDRYRLMEACNSNLSPIPEDIDLKIHEPGPMTAREFLQFLGTDIMRKMFQDVWLTKCMSRIKKDKPKIALVCDVRFDNEFAGIYKEGGIVLGLTKDIGSGDNHSSENVDLTKASKIIDNKNISIKEQNKLVYLALKELNCKNLTDLEKV